MRGFSICSFISKGFIAALFTVQLAFAGAIDDCKDYANFGLPGTSGDLLCRKGYLLAHDPVRKTPVWVIEHLESNKLNGDVERTNDFKPDPDLEHGKRAELTDYEGSGYQRGHMAPAENMSWDEQAMHQSFLLSNMVPQNGPMNGGIWRVLEDKARKWAEKRGSVYVFTGPVYADNYVTIGTNKVAVPNKLFKIVFDPERKEAIAFIMPNQKLKSADMPQYVVSIRDVEKVTRLNFLNNLSKEEQEKIETVIKSEVWQ